MIGLGFWSNPSGGGGGGSGTPSDATPIAVNATGTAGVGTDYSRADHRHALAKATIESITALGSGVVKASSNALTAATLVNADVSASAAIAYSKLTLTGAIVNADVSASAAIAGTKVSPDFGSQNIATTGFLGIGASVSVATTGAIRLVNTGAIRGLNFAGDGNLNYVSSNASNQIQYGGTQNLGLLFGTSTSGLHDFQINAVSVMKIGATYLSLGSTPATTGDVRLSKAGSVKLLNNAGSGDINAFSLSAGDVITYGGTVNSGIVVGTATGSKISFTVNAGEIAKVDGSGITVPAMSTAGLVHNSSAGLFTSSTLVNADVNAAAAIDGTKISPSFGSQNVVTTGNLSVGTAPATNSTGINLPNATAIWFRNQAGSANLNGLSLDSSNNINIGQSTTIGTTAVNASTTVQSIIGGTARLTVQAASVTIGAPIAQFVLSASAPLITQATNVTNGATAQKLQVLAQTASGTTSTGGDLELGPGTGTSANGVLRLVNVATTTTAPGAGGGSALPITPAGYVSVTIAGTARQIAYY